MPTAKGSTMVGSYALLHSTGAHSAISISCLSEPSYTGLHCPPAPLRARYYPSAKIYTWGL